MVLALLAVVFQVSDVVVIAVGVVAAALAADQTFDLRGRPCSFLPLLLFALLLRGGWGWLWPPGPGPTARLHSVDQQHLTDAVGAKVLQQLGAVRGLEATGPALEWLSPLLLLLLRHLVAGLAAGQSAGLAAGLDGGFAAGLGSCQVLGLTRTLLVSDGLWRLWV